MCKEEVVAYFTTRMKALIQTKIWARIFSVPADWNWKWRDVFVIILSPSMQMLRKNP